MIRLPRLNLTKLQIAFLWIIIILVTLFISIFSLYLAIYRPQERFISITNFYNSSVTIKYNDVIQELKPFDVYSVRILTGNDVKIEFFDKNDSKIKDISFNNLELKPDLLEVILSSNDSYCFVSADVTNLYYSTTSNDVSLTGILSSTPVEKVAYSLDTVKSAYVYPGMSLISDIPQNLKDKNFIGIYPILCSDVNDINKITQNALMFKSYNSEEQRKYYDDQKTKILNTTSRQGLNNL